MAVGGAPNTPPNGPPPSDIQTKPPFVAFKTDNVPPSQFVYFQLNDILGIALVSNTPGLTAIFSYRILTPQGEIKEGRVQCLPTVVGTSTNTFIPFLEGWLLSASLRLNSVGVVSQWAYATIQFSRTQTTNDERYGVIWQGYIFNNQPLGFPDSPTQTIDSGQGVLRSITGSTPAAGADINEVIPLFRRWTLLAFKAQLVTSATVANRFAGINLDDGVNSFYTIHSSVAQAASGSIVYNATPGQPFFNDASNFILLPLPTPISLKASYRIRTNTIGLQAGDQWSAPQYLVAEWGMWDN